MLGFSIYLGQALSGHDHDYMLRMRNAGFLGVFTSLQIPEEDSGQVLSRLTQLTQWCHDLGLEIVADISATGFKKIGVDLNDLAQIQALQLTGLRIDDGISMEIVAKLSRHVPIVLNASTLTRSDFVALQEEHADFDHLTAGHNYYPRPETGLDRRWLHEKNHWLHHLHFKTAAFVPGDGQKRGPIFAGLPTLEEQRKMNPFAAALSLYRQGVDDVYVGDPRLSEDTIQMFTTFLQDHAILLHLERPADLLTKQDWHNRADVARDVIRLTEGRKRQIFETTPFTPAMPRPIGAVTVDNCEYGRYAGELQIMRRDLPLEPRVNVINQVVQKDLPLLKLIGSYQKIIFSSHNN